MAIVYSADDTNEYAHDTDFEQFGNANLYGVISGCAVTYDATDLTVDIAAGQILHNGTLVAVAVQADALTLVADGSNKRWSYITLDSAGSAVLVSGDAAASASVEPTKPELGDRVVLAMVKIEAAQTVANDISVKLDKRIMVKPSFPIRKSADETVTTSATLQNDDEFTWPVAIGNYIIRGWLYLSTTANGGFKLAFTTPATTTIAIRQHVWNAGTSGAAGTQVTSGTAVIATTAALTACYIDGTIEVTVSGTFTMQFAQNASHADATTVKEGSFLELVPVV